MRAVEDQVAHRFVRDPILREAVSDQNMLRADSLATNTAHAAFQHRLVLFEIGRDDAVAPASITHLDLPIL